MLNKYEHIQRRWKFRCTVNHDHSLWVDSEDAGEFIVIEGDEDIVDDVSHLIAALQEYKKYLIEEVGL